MYERPDRHRAPDQHVDLKQVVGDGFDSAEEVLQPVRVGVGAQDEAVAELGRPETAVDRGLNRVLEQAQDAVDFVRRPCFLGRRLNKAAEAEQIDKGDVLPAVYSVLQRASALGRFLSREFPIILAVRRLHDPERRPARGRRG